ncbi:MULTISPECIES: GntR family transcriptional regulator [unclassified Streptococcus]|uniref:GntR family transcriptional regulator n=1 Tax=unclassified Streptococcus TaxID=2608887 RepID=UPI001071A050|nr:MULTISPECIES: GntR family transcriptional regulator [unclassified Streptococcus]MBF0787341.1 GntR family transcriptional regulator [Streptococcus sp. 19428wC2_LYSM12]MCQ9211121.1 GntR family transcriptional regulator [Streptococcus sp. B01]MCQ9214396.1 GntR family transcriptional regulator [Streptococcus sp. O1]TFV05689.1 GntR family transcriptional regulator [Streptococcus sp. LYSM12]
MADISSTKPLYLQLVETLETEIRDKMVANEKLLSERELTQVYGVSRITVRLALQELEKRGLVYKVHGKGTFVSEVGHQVVDLSMAYSFTEQMRRVGRVPNTQILSFERIQATDYLAQRLQIAIGEPVFELERLRLADGIPMMLERTYVPALVFDSLSEEELQTRSLYAIFAEDYGQIIRLAEEEFYASIALENEANLLDIHNGDAVLHLVRKTYNDKNRMIEYTFSIARADQFRYKIIHTRGE